MSLSRRLDCIRDDFLAADVPARMRAALDKNIERLVAMGAANRALGPGSQAPEVQFASLNGTPEPVQLSKLLDQGPVVLTWFRGNW